ncbi:MAG: D-alanyl-D-alanine carboxypeptidase, partial [Pseudomonadota bacterium]
LDSGVVIDARNAETPLAPASVAKLVTAAYALDRLGPEHRFETRVARTGKVVNGALDGDLILVGGGDPELNTDTLVPLIQQVAESGLRRVDGQFLVDTQALPELPAIEPTQPEDAAYNPGVSALNLNFNRVRVEWSANAGDEDLRVTARADRLNPAVDGVRVTIDRSRRSPAFRHQVGVEGEEWTLAGSAVRRPGGRWLPVRMPAAYAAGVFRDLAKTYGLSLGPVASLPHRNVEVAAPGLVALAPVASVAAQEASVTGKAAAGLPLRDLATQGLGATAAPEVIARYRGRPLPQILRSMLKHSTNLTAEIVGVAATKQDWGRVGSLEASARALNTWAAAEIGTSRGDPGLDLRNHSGLSVASRLAPARVADLLVEAAQQRSPGVVPHARLPGSLAALLPRQRVRDRRVKFDDAGLDVVAKTGTMSFVRGLAGYIATPRGRRLAFTIFSNDLGRRAVASGRAARNWRGRAQYFERALIRAWVTHIDRV